MGQIVWYTIKVGPDVSNTTRKLDVNMSHTGTEHWKALENLSRYLKDKETKGINIGNIKYIKLFMLYNSKYATNK